MAEWIFCSSILIVLIIMLRYLLKEKITLRLQYALWALVLIRLLIPVSLGSTAVSILNVVKVPTVNWTMQEDSIPPADDPALTPPARLPEDQSEQPSPEPAVPANPAVGLEQQTQPRDIPVSMILNTIWITGMGIVGLVLLVSNLRFAIAVKRSRTKVQTDACHLPVYVSSAVDTPCLFGLFRPTIYLTADVAANETMLRHAIAHEMTHFRHADHIWVLLRGVCLMLHWYNPLVWLAAILSRKDSELACDEATIRRIGEAERASYGRTLLDITCQKRTKLLLTATTMTGSHGNIQERIQLLVKKPKMAAYVAVLVVLVAAIVAGCTFTGAREKANAEEGLPTDPAATIEQTEPSQTQPTTTEPTEPIKPTDPTEPNYTGTPLTQAQIDQVNQAFTPITINDAGKTTTTPISCFFTSYYDSVENLHLGAFLRYFPWEEQASEAEIQLLKQLENSHLTDIISTPVWKCTAESINQVLQQYAGITLADLQGVGAENLMYLEEYDAYYLTTSDFGAGVFTCKWGEIIEDTVYLYSQSGVRLTLRNQQGEYKIVAHQIMES